MTDYHKGEHIDWWQNLSTDKRFTLLKKYGFQNEKKPWVYKPLTDKAIFRFWTLENNVHSN